MHKIKLIAPKYLIDPLAILGIETFAAESEAEAKKALGRATAKKEPALIFISERLAVDLQPEMEKLNRKADINVVMIPDNRGSTGLAASQIDKLVRNSIGAEVIIRK
jgi:V/A-type H+-transporting ATPase subunit F